MHDNHQSQEHKKSGVITTQETRSTLSKVQRHVFDCSNKGKIFHKIFVKVKHNQLR